MALDASLDLHDVESELFALCGFRSISDWEGDVCPHKECYMRTRYWNCPGRCNYSTEHFHAKRKANATWTVVRGSSNPRKANATWTASADPEDMLYDERELPR